jgi:large subunit ribosomal protein L1
MTERSLLEAVQEALQAAPPRNFEETVELAVNLKDLDLSLPKNRVEDDIPLPKGRGKPVKVAVFGTPELISKARGVADLTVSPEQMDEIFKDKRTSRKQVGQIDYFLAEAPLMPMIGKRLGQVLGPRGKMPRPLPPGTDPTPLIQALRRNVRVRSKGKRTFHVPVGTRGMPPADIAENVQTVLDRVMQKLERGRANIDSVYLKTTMGPAVRVW